jgi:hypothetical protein
LFLRKEISLILVLLILLHGIFHVLVFKVLEMKYKREIRLMIKQSVPEEKLIRFVFKKDITENRIPGFRWMKQNEFMLNGEMYDIVWSQITGDSVHYKCIHDVKESGLFANIGKHLDNYLRDNPEKNKELLSLTKSLSKFYNLPNPESIFRQFLIENILFTKLFSVLKGETEIVLPPPEVS